MDYEMAILLGKVVAYIYVLYFCLSFLIGQMLSIKNLALAGYSTMERILDNWPNYSINVKRELCQAWGFSMIQISLLYSFREIKKGKQNKSRCEIGLGGKGDD